MPLVTDNLGKTFFVDFNTGTRQVIATADLPAAREQYGTPLTSVSQIPQTEQRAQRELQSRLGINFGDSISLDVRTGRYMPSGQWTPPATVEPPPTVDYAAEAAAEFPWLTGGLLSSYADFWAETGSPSAALTRLRQTGDYKNRFSAIFREDGTMRMSENEYLSQEVGFREVLAEYGRNPADYESQFDQLFINEVDANEFGRAVGEAEARFTEIGATGNNGLADMFINSFIQKGSLSESLEEVRSSSAYAQVFEGNRREDGTLRMEEEEYFAYKRGWQRTLAGFGLDPNEFTARGRLKESVEGELSVQEVNQRLQITQDGILDQVGAIRQFYAENYGLELNQSAILGMAIDPDVQKDVLERRITAGQIGGEASLQGFVRDIERAEELARLGITQREARQTYSQAGQQLRGLAGASRRANQGNVGIGQYENAALFQDAETLTGFDRALRREASTYSSTADTQRSRDGLGLSGLAPAMSTLDRFKELSAKQAPDPTQKMLGDVQAEIRNLEGSLTHVEAAFVTALDRLIDQMPQPAAPVDLSPLLAALEARREPQAAPLPTELLEALQRPPDAPLITEDQWGELMERLVAAVPQSQTTGVGGGSRLRNLDREYINPATEDSLAEQKGSHLLYSLTSLGAGEEVTTDWLDTQDLASLLPFAFGDQQLATIELEWSDDGVTADTGLLGTTDLLASETLTSGFYVYIDQNTTMIRRYVRFHIINGGTAQGAGLFEADLWGYGHGSYPFTIQGITDDLTNLSSALLTRSVGAGTKPDGTFDNVPLDGTITADDFETSGQLPSGSTPSFDAVGPIVASNVIDTGWLDVTDWNYQTFHMTFHISGIKVFLMNASDTSGNNSVTTSFAFPNATTQGAGTSIEFGAEFFDDYFRVVIINDSGTASDAWGYRSRALKAEPGSVVLSLDQPILDFFPAPVVQAISKGRQPDGDYEAIRSSGSDAGNSSSTPLGIGGTFTGTPFDASGFAGGMVVVRSDVVSASDGLKIEFAEDEAMTFVHRTIDVTYDVVDVGQPVFFPIMQGEYYRVSYTNGGTAQTEFVLRTELLATPAQVPLGKLNADIDGSALAQIVRAGLLARNDAGTYTNLRQSDNGGLRTSVVEHEVETPIKALDTFTTNQSNVGTTAVQIVGSPLTDRKTVLVKNRSDSSKVIYIGTSSAVTASDGYELAAGEGVELDLDPGGTNIWAIAASGTQRACWLEIAGT